MKSRNIKRKLLELPNIIHIINQNYPILPILLSMIKNIIKIINQNYPIFGQQFPQGTGATTLLPGHLCEKKSHQLSNAMCVISLSVRVLSNTKKREKNNFHLAR